MNLQDLQSRIESLSINDQNLIINQLANLISELDISITDIQNMKKEAESRHCPHCSSSNTIKIGKQYGVQRFSCKNCKHDFRASTGSFVAGLKKGKGEKLKLYLRHFIAGKSIRYCATACEISVPTSFNWRHRILAALQKQQELTVLEGIVESDDVFLAYSQKGQKNLTRPARKRGKGALEPKKRGISDEKVAVIISHDRQGKKHLQVATRGRISEENLNEVLKDKIAAESILCSDTHHSYIAFANRNKIEHKTVKASAKEFVKEGKYHIQHVNQTATELKRWLNGFNGVSTKYLQNYLNWFSVIKRLEKASIPIKELVLMTCASFEAITVLKNIPKLPYI